MTGNPILIGALKTGFPVGRIPWLIQEDLSGLFLFFCATDLGVSGFSFLCSVPRCRRMATVTPNLSTLTARRKERDKLILSVYHYY